MKNLMEEKLFSLKVIMYLNQIIHCLSITEYSPEYSVLTIYKDKSLPISLGYSFIKDSPIPISIGAFDIDFSFSR